MVIAVFACALHRLEGDMPESAAELSAALARLMIEIEIQKLYTAR